MTARCGFRQATRQRRPPPEKGVKMAKSRDRRLCTPKDNDGGDDKEKVISLAAQRRSRAKSTENPTPPRMNIKMAYFRCKNEGCFYYINIRNDVSADQAKDFAYCMDCGADTMVRVDVYECAKCEKSVIVLYNKPVPEACSCGHTKLNLK